MSGYISFWWEIQGWQKINCQIVFSYLHCLLCTRGSKQSACLHVSICLSASPFSHIYFLVFQWHRSQLITSRSYDTDDIMITGSKVKVSHRYQSKSCEHDSCETSERIWTKTCRNISCSLATNWLDFSRSWVQMSRSHKRILAGAYWSMVWHQLLYSPLMLMSSVISCQCLQQIDGRLWSPQCEKMWIHHTYFKLWTDQLKKESARDFFTHN